MLIYCDQITTRFVYITDLIIGEMLGISFRITSNREEYISTSEARICYNQRSISEKECLIIPSGLLNEKGIGHQKPGVIDFAGTKAIYPVYTKETCMPFDIFSAVFFMVSRYEEYLPHMRDSHGRFLASSSLAYQKGFLKTPVVNVWVKELGHALKSIYPDISIKENKYSFVPTVDIDSAWAFRHKGFFRSLGGFIKDLMELDKESLRLRFRSMLKMSEDPLDTFELMSSLHKKYNLRPLFFILFAQYNEYDKNTPVNNIHFRKLIKSLADEGVVGIHPSYASNENELLLKREINGLSEVLHREVTKSRQHFLKLSLPDTYRNLLAQDITDDYTMGFASEVGFRAGTCTSFLWYDLELERVTPLRVHPFAFMDGTIHDYMKVEAEGAMNLVRPIINSVKSVGGTLITLWHNETLSDWRRWKGWIPVYEQILKEASEEKINN